MEMPVQHATDHPTTAPPHHRVATQWDRRGIGVFWGVFGIRVVFARRTCSTLAHQEFLRRSLPHGRGGCKSQRSVRERNGCLSQVGGKRAYVGRVPGGRVLLNHRRPLHDAGNLKHSTSIGTTSERVRQSACRRSLFPIPCLITYCHTTITAPTRHAWSE